MYLPGTPSGKANLFKLWTVFPPEISCMGRIVPCSLAMKVTVMVLLSSVPMFPLLLLNFNKDVIFILKKNTNQNLCTQYTTRLSGDAKTKRFSPPDLHV